MDMTNHPLLALAADDPPPFPSSNPQLQKLDRSLLCTICKEPFTAPVSISCGHSFCSACIRSYFDEKKKCPTCHADVTEGSIRRNRALEEMTDAWEAARPSLITLVTAPPPTRKRPPPEPSSSRGDSKDSIKRMKLDKNSHSRSQSPAIKRSPEGGEVIEIPESDDLLPEEMADQEEEELTENDEAPCPICSAKLPIASIPGHIERGCPPPKSSNHKANGTGNQKADWKRVFAGAGMGKSKEVEMKRILKPNYSLATPADLKEILNTYGLPLTGDKPTLESRVQEWIKLWNANLDSSHPNSLPSLRNKLNESEASRRRDKERGKDNLGLSLGTAEGLKRYAVEKKGEFERLRKEIIERDRKRARGDGESGSGKDSAIEVD